MPDADEPGPRLRVAGAEAVGGVDGVGGRFVCAGLEVDRHDLAAVFLLDLRTDALVELVATVPALLSMPAVSAG